MAQNCILDVELGAFQAENQHNLYFS